MKGGLKIYACSGIGETDERLQYWTDDTKTVNNTRAVNGLLAKINLLAGEIAYDQITADEIVERANIIDLYVVCLKAAQKYNGEELYAAGRAIQEMISTSAFSSTSLDDEERDLNLLNLIDRMYQMVANGEGSSSDSGEFYKWFVENVVEENYNTLTDAQRAAVQGIGGDFDAGAYLYDAGGYYTYCLLSDEQAKKMSPTFYKKRKLEQKVLATVHKAYDNMYPSPEDVDTVIYTGMREYYKQDPKQVAKELYNGTTSIKGIGVIDSILLIAIAALITAITPIITAILQFCAAVVAAKYAVPTDEEATNGCPEESDFSKLEKAQSNKYLKWGLLGVVALFILKKLK